MDRLNDVIEALEQTDEIGVAVGRDEALLIAQLLRAGAEMRVAEYARDVSKANAAWDAALKEGEG